MNFVYEKNSLKYELIGGKATALSKIGRAIDNIPDWFVVSFIGFDTNRKVIKADAIEEIKEKLNGFDDNFFMYLEDADLCKRVNQVSKLMYLPTATVIHKWAKGSHKNKTLFKHHVNSMKYYFKKWGYKLF